MPIELAITIAFILVLLNSFFVAAEFALVKIRPTRIEQLAATGSITARMARHAVSHLDAYLSATQLGITLASIGLGWVGEPAFSALLRPAFLALDISDRVAFGISFAMAYFFVTLLHVVIGELMPKSWAIQQSERVSLAVAFPLHWFYVLFLPLIALLNGIANALLRLFGIRPASPHEVAHSQEELDMILAASTIKGVLRESEVDLMRRVFRFGDKNVADIMVPRVDMTVIEHDKTVDEALTTALQKPFSRFPVIGDNADDIRGILHIRDVMRLHRERKTDFKNSMRQTIFVPPSKQLDDLLHEFQQTRTHLAIVRDEYGGTAGLVTLEDVIEEIVGEISDESDVAPPEIRRERDSWYVLGTARLEDVNEEIGSSFSSEEVDSIGGLLSEILGRPACKGDAVRHEGWRLEAIEADTRRVSVVKVEKELETNAD